MFRAQFAFPLPASPCFDQKCMYSFDLTNLPVFQGTLVAGAETGRIPLAMDKDADFVLRGISTQGSASLAFRLEDCKGNPLSDLENVINSTNFELPDEYSNAAGAGFVILEGGDGLKVPAGGNFRMYLFNAGTATINLQTCAVNLHGVKWYSGEVCP